MPRKPDQYVWKDGWSCRESRERETRSDAFIEEDINECLTQNVVIDAADIDVLVQDGTVTLRGTVDNGQDKRLAKEIVDAVAGVTEVKNEIRVEQRKAS